MSQRLYTVLHMFVSQGIMSEFGVSRVIVSVVFFRFLFVLLFFSLSEGDIM